MIYAMVTTYFLGVFVTAYCAGRFARMQEEEGVFVAFLWPILVPVMLLVEGVTRVLNSGVAAGKGSKQ